MLLAELAFSPPEQLPRLVEKNLDSLNEEFYSFLEAKIRISKNQDEKETLTLLKDAVTDLMQKILQAAMNRGDISVDDVKAAGLSAPAISTFSGADMAVLSYDKLIDEVSWHTFDRVMSHVWVSHVTYSNESSDDQLMESV